MELKEKRKTGVMMVPRHTWMHFSNCEEMKKDMPMAVAIGHHPAYDIAANVSGRYEMDELEVASRLLGEPVELVKCETIDIEVPAHAELVIEGYVKCGIREEEGPFGEFTCYFSAEGMNPVFEVTAITMREDAIYRNIQSTEFTEHQALCVLPMEADIYARLNTLQSSTLDVHNVSLPLWGSQWLVILQVTAHYQGQVRDAIMSALSSNYLHPKIVVAVDEDVNIHDPAEIWWAVSTRVNPESDIFVSSGHRIHPMDISCLQISPPGEKTWQRIGGKLGIDATKPPTFKKKQRSRFNRCRPMGWGVAKLEDFLSKG
jgi:2,5-furandicarboxylate decarboxylase 1